MAPLLRPVACLLFLPFLFASLVLGIALDVADPGKHSPNLAELIDCFC